MRACGCAGDETKLPSSPRAPILAEIAALSRIHRERPATAERRHKAMIRIGVGAIAAAIVAMTAAGLYLIFVTPRTALPVGYRLEEFAIYVLIQASFGVVGSVLAIRRSRNPLGWLFLATALTSAWLQMSAGYAINAIVNDRPDGQIAAWIYNMSAGAILAPVIPAIVLFPDGRPSTRWGRYLLWLTPANVFGLAFLALMPGPLLNMPSVQNPYGLPANGAAVATMAIVVIPWFGAMIALFVLDLSLRIRAASGVLAQQMKWLVWSAVLIIATILLAGTVALFTAAGPSGGFVTYLMRALFTVAVTTLPIALGLAIVRYRLYDIDVLINRTLVYGATISSISAGFVAAALILQAILRPITSGSDVAIAGSTLLTVAAFQPLRRRIQAGIDQRFYRSRYDASRTLDAFATRMRDQVDIDAVRHEVLDVVGSTLRPAHASVWLRQTPR
jgi:hypothetical protein